MKGGINLKRNYASVLLGSGKVTEVRLPHVYSGVGSGIYMTPPEGCLCTVAITANQEPFLLNYYPLNPQTENKEGKRPVPFNHSTLLKNTSGDFIEVSFDEKTPQITMSSPTTYVFAETITDTNGATTVKNTITQGRIDLRMQPNAHDTTTPADPTQQVLLDRTGVTISAVSEFDDLITTTKDSGVKTTTPESVPGRIDIKLQPPVNTDGTQDPPVQRILIDKTAITFVTPGGDGSELVTRKQLQDVIDQLTTIINSLSLPVSGTVAGPPAPITAPKAAGTIGLQTQEPD